MLKRKESDHIYQHAYVPEHLTEYVRAVSGGAPHYFQDYLCYLQRNHLLFIGYPLADNPAKLSRVYPAVCDWFNPHSITLVADDLSGLPEGEETQAADRYYRLDLPLKSLNPEVAYMVRRAQRELKVEVGQFGREHNKIIKNFVRRRDLGAAQIYIFKNVAAYMKRSTSTCLLEARRSGRLVAFSIVDLGSAQHAFYQFNFRSAKVSVPGASDYLFYEMVRLAQSKGKRAINLGLGVHPGIQRFKEKWGGKAFLEHRSVFIQRQQKADIGKLSKKL
ncbi:MAG: hypothetical protein PVI00_18240 [Desulfobacterales bacterium]|jgi:hypothetical protein